MQGREQKPKRARLHRRLNRGCPAHSLVVPKQPHDPIPRRAADGMEQKGSELQFDAGVEDGLRAGRDGGAHQDDGRHDADDGARRLHRAANLGHELVQGDADDDGQQHDLDGGHGHTDRVHVDDGAEAELADERGHEDATDGGGGGHEHGERDVAAGDVRAQVGRLTTVDATDQDQTRE